MVAGVLLAVSFAVMVAGALVFTNAVEWLGVRLDLGHGAVGSVLAAVATAMPESLIPVVAIIEGRQREEIAIGAIAGAPFLLATLAMAVSGAATLIYRARRATAQLQLSVVKLFGPTGRREFRPRLGGLGFSWVFCCGWRFCWCGAGRTGCRSRGCGR